MGVEHRCFFTHFSEAVHRLHRDLLCLSLYQTWAWKLLLVIHSSSCRSPSGFLGSSSHCTVSIDFLLLPSSDRLALLHYPAFLV